MKKLSAFTLTNFLRCSYLLLFFLLISGTGAVAQVDTTKRDQNLILGKRIIIETKDGSVIQGRFMGYTDDGIRVVTESTGEFVVLKSHITWMKVVEEDLYKEGKYWFENPNSTRYLFSQSAYSLKKGEAYFQNTYLVLNSVYYGITDNLTIGGGFELMSALSGNPVFFINPKYSFRISDKLRAGIAALYVDASSRSSRVFSGISIGYGILTYGNTDDNITLGVGYGFVEQELANRPVFTLSGMKRLDSRIALVSENWIIPRENYYGVYSYGLRFMGKKLTVDLALLNNPDITNRFLAIGFPYLDFIIKLGKQ